MVILLFIPLRISISKVDKKRNMKFNFQIFYIFVVKIEAIFWHSSPQSEAGIHGLLVSGLSRLSDMIIRATRVP